MLVGSEGRINILRLRLALGHLGIWARAVSGKAGAKIYRPSPYGHVITHPWIWRPEAWLCVH